MGIEQFQGSDSIATSPICLAPQDVDRPAMEKPAERHRVLHVVNGEHYSGAERVQDLLAARLPMKGFDIGFACLKPGRFNAARQSQDTPLYDIEMRNRFDFSAVWKLARLAKRGQYELLHAHTPRAALVTRLASRLARLPMVYHVHSPTSRDTDDGFRNRLNSLVERWSLSRVDALVAVSHSLGRYMRATGHSQDIINVVPNGVPTNAAGRNSRPPRDPWTIGTVALFRPRKGLEVLLDALAEVRSAGLQVRLRAVGPFETGEYENQMHQRTEALGLVDVVEWTGFTHDVSAALSSFDLFVLPSLFGEGLPMVVLEAMAAGVPVIGTRVEGVPEAIDHGVTGLLAEPNNVNDLASCIRRLVLGELNWRDLRECAIRRHAETFCDEVMADGLAEVYRSVLQKRHETPGR